MAGAPLLRLALRLPLRTLPRSLAGPAAMGNRPSSSSAAAAAGAGAPAFARAGKIGDTQMLDISFLSRNPKVTILGKCEFMNPTGSIKDRMVEYVVGKAKAKGEIRDGDTIVAATSGNTGASVGMVAAMLGHPYIVITNAKCSQEKRDIMGAYGGEVRVGPSGVPASSPEHYQNLAIALCAENEGYYDLDQYGNQLNPETYYHTLGPEIWRDTAGRVTHFVAGGSTGGTVSGTGRYLKEQNPAVHVHMPDPYGSVVYDFHVNQVPEDQLQTGSYQCEGVGKDSITPVSTCSVAPGGAGD